jgi:hypothetical protein
LDSLRCGLSNHTKIDFQTLRDRSLKKDQSSNSRHPLRPPRQLYHCSIALALSCPTLPISFLPAS